MSNKVAKAIANNFRRADTRVVEEQQPGVADKLDLKAPPLSTERRAGNSVAAALASQQREAFAAGTERYKREKADYEKQRHNAILARVEARRLL